MRLRTIRLAGFKSFVDPLSIDLPGDLIGVVGPNGCGKSNIIDAVRWVMGEISARHLRGSSMADVVFNGSNTRKPVGQASVELVFDNSDARIGGRFAQYAEVAVKRQVGRDGQSAYYLNGTRCRRRDVIDVFLGTGLGPRSYAVIEQGTISRLVEAKPDELREVLEEAAGISKYKERRRETENRIKHTEENLSRISDLRDELGKRLERLERQAKQAERYKTLRIEERARKSELLALRWRALDTESQAHSSAITEQQTAVEKALAELRSAENELVTRREAQRESGEAFNAVYRQKIEADAAIERAEEAIASLGRRGTDLDKAVEDDRAALAEAGERERSDERRLGELRDRLATAQPDVQRMDEQARAAESGLTEADEALAVAQARLDEANQRAAEPAGVVQREQARIEQLDRSVMAMTQRRDQLQADATALDTTGLVAQLATLAPRLASIGSQREQFDASMERQGARVRDLRDQHASTATELHDLRGQLQACGGRIASLESLQQEALGGAGAATDRWLAERGLGGASRLAEMLRVAPGWERAAEVVLGSWLDALALEGEGDGLDSLAASAAELEQVRVSLLGPASAAPGRSPAAGTALLADQLQLAPGAASIDLAALAAGVHIAEDLAAALALAATLQAGESVVTRDGHWLGPSWLRVVRGESEDGVLRREQALRALQDERDSLKARVEQTGARLASLTSALREADEQLASAQADVARAQREQSELSSSNATLGERLEQMRRNTARLDSERSDLDQRAREQQGELETARSRLTEATQSSSTRSGERDAAVQAREQAQQAANGARDRARSERAVATERQVAASALQAQVQPLSEGLERQREQITVLEQRIGAQQEAREGLAQPLQAARDGLEQALSTRSEHEEKLASARGENESLEQAVREGDERRRAAENAAEALRESLASLRMQGEETRVRRQTLEEQLAEFEQTPAALLETVSEEASVQAWEAEVEALEKRIQRLGAVNLAAIEEFDSEAERKSYLDAQFADLDEALTTLRDAIGRIDRETRQRFKETFEKVNSGLQVAFPRLFGGGEASLQLVGDDLLDTGVTVMARPPGKRNASIGLLSGGEKALTAVALVFSIFELNPAPFCLLDEVDAPLDDSNVGRFCELVKAMSENVQFLIVTHNKITMEATQQLIGVTMQEPGVSRLVAVDLDEAVEMAAA